MKQFRFEAVILKKQPFFEKDFLVEVFSREYGKVKVLAKYAQKKSSGFLEPTNQVDLHVFRGKSFLLVQQVSITSSFPQYRLDYNRLSLACYFLNLVRLSVSYDQPNDELYDVLIEALKQLSVAEDIDVCRRFFEMNLLLCEGVVTPEQIQKGVRFEVLFEEYTGFRVPMVSFV